MIKLFVFLTLGILILILTRKLIMLFTQNKVYQYLLYIGFLMLFLLFIFIFRDNTVHNNNGSYTPPKYDGKEVTPGKVE